MANQVFLAPTANFTETTLSGAITDSADTITLASTTGLQAPGYVVVNRVDSNGTATPNNREVISYTGIAGNDLTGCGRGADNSTARGHGAGSKVETAPTVGMYNSLATIVSAGLDGSGYLRAINSPASIAFGQFIRTAVSSIASVARAHVTFLENTQAAVTSIASISRLETPFLRAPSALVSLLTVSGLINAAGASIVGFNPTVLRFQSIQTALTSIGSTAAYANFMVTSIPASFGERGFGKLTFESTLNPGSSSSSFLRMLVNDVQVYETSMIWPSENNFVRNWNFVVGTTIGSGASIAIQTKANDGLSNFAPGVAANMTLLLAEK